MATPARLAALAKGHHAPRSAAQRATLAQSGGWNREVITIGGATRSAIEWRKLLHVSARTYQHRKLHEGMTPQQALLYDARCVQPLAPRHGAGITMHGITLTAAAWCRLLGVTRRTFEDRTERQCLPRREALLRPVDTRRWGARRRSAIKIGDEVRSERGWCRHFGITWGSYRSLRRKGTSPREALLQLRDGRGAQKARGA